MSVAGITYPVPFERIPEEVARLQGIIREREEDLATARSLLQLVQRCCPHTNAERGSNERDGSWMNPCPHCRATE